MGYTNEFNLEIGTTLNTSNIPKKLQQLNAELQKSTSVKIPVTVTVNEKSGLTAIKNIYKEVNTYKDKIGNTYKQIRELDSKGNVLSDNLVRTSSALRTLTTETHKFTNTAGEIQKWTTSVDSLGEKTQTRVKQYINDSKELVTETSKWGKNAQGQWQQIGDTIRNITDDYKQSTQVLNTETHKFVDNQGAVQKWTTTIDDSGKIVSTRVKQVVDDMGNLTTTTSKLVSEGAGKPFKKMGDDIVQVSEILKETTTQTTTSFGKITDTVNGVTKTFDGTITTIKKMSSNGEELTTVISKYTNDMGQAVERTEQFDKMGNQVATTMRKIGEATKVKDTKTSTFIDEKGVKTVTQYVDGIANAKTVTSEYKNKLGELVTETKKYEIEQDNLGKTQERLVSINTKTKQSLIDERKEKAKLLNETTKLIDEKNKLKQAQERLNKALVSTTTNKSRGKVTQFGDTSGKEYDAVITKIEQIDASGKITIKTIQEFTNSLGQLVQQIRVTDENGKKLAEDSISISNAFDKENEKIRQQQQEHERLIQETTNLIIKKNELKQAQIQLNNALTSTTTTTKGGMVTEFGDTSGRQYNALITTIKEIDASGRVTIKTIEEFTNSEGKLVQQTRVTDENLKKLVADNKNVSDTTKTASTNVKNLGSSAEKANYGVKNLGWSLSDAISRLTNFYLASLPIRAVQTAITDTISTVKEFDSALIEFRKVSDLAGESLTNYVAKLAEMGEVTGSTMQAMVEASTEFRKSGFTDEDSAKLASIAEKYRNIADEEISAADSASFIIAQMKAFNIEAGQAEHIIDSVNEVANNFSVSSADLAKNLGNMSAIMAINNVSMEEQIGMLTGVTEITRNASSASRGLVMISSRLTQVLDDTSSTGKKLTKIYNDLGIELKDESGQLRSHYDILSDLAGQWNTLSENQQKYIALTSAGARQQQNFVSLMENWNQVANATATAYNSMGSAQKENEKVMDSVAKKVEILKSQFQQLVIGDGGLQDFVKLLLNVGIALLKFANSDIGKTIIKVSALLGAFVLLQKGFLALPTLTNSLAKSMVKLAYSVNAATVTQWEMDVSLQALGIEEAIVTEETIGLGEAFKMLTAAMLTNPVVWLVAGLTALVGITMYATQKAEEHTESIKKAQEEVEKLKLEIYDLKQAVEDEATVTQAEKDRLAYLEKRLELQEKLANLAPKAKTVIPDEYEENLGSMTETGAVEYTRTVARPDISRDELSVYMELNKEIKEWNDNSKEGLEILEEKYNQSQTYLTSLEAERDKLGKLRDSYAENQKEYNILINRRKSGIELSYQESERLKELEHSQRELNDRDKERLSVLESNVGAYKKSIEEIHTYQEAIDEYGESSEEADSILKDFASDLGISEEELVTNANAMGLSVDAYHNCALAIKQADDAIDGFQSSISTLQSAVDEYNESQEFSIDTVQALLQLQPEYLNMLIEENGQLHLNEQAITDKANALIEERKQTALQMAYEKLAAIERGNNQSAAESESSAIDGNTSSLDTETSALSRNTVEQYANRIARNDKAKGTAASQVVRELEAELKVLDKIGSSYKSITSSAKKAGSAGKSGAKQAKDAQKELNKELQDTLNNYKKVISWIGKQYDRKTDSIKDAKDAATASIEKEIKALEKEKDTIIDHLKEKKDALEDEKDAILDGIEVEIKALEDSREAREKYWDAQIDALKKANDERKEALELQEKLDALERARNTKVKIYKEGQGFVFDVDQTKVAEAQKALDEYLSEKAYEDELERLENLKKAEIDNYNKRIDALNDYKDKTQENYEKLLDLLDKYIDRKEKKYDAEIEMLNEHKAAVEEEYDAEIEMYEDYKQQFEDMVNAYEEQQTKLLAAQLTGIDFENDNWMTRLDNLQHFVDEYNRLQAQLDTGNGTTTASTDTTSDTSNNGGSKDTNNKKASSEPKYDEKGYKLNDNPSKTQNVGFSSQTKTVYVPTGVAEQIGGSSGAIKVSKHASGIGSIQEDEIAVVGENPNKEIVIGSKINNGELMSLDKGAGVVNANSSNTLASMLNQVGQFGSSGFGSGNGTLNNNINNDSLVVNGVTIEGSKISDPQTFVNGLLSLKSEALQRAYRHR